MIYGYNLANAFSEEQRKQLLSMGSEGLANSLGLLYPFFLVEFKADGPTGAGSLWVATNQCLGGTPSCVSITEQLNNRLRGCRNDKTRMLDTVAFSAAMNGSEARLYISWKHELTYYMQIVESFCLQRPEHFLEFRKYTRNIIDWGKNLRLQSVQEALDILREESQEVSRTSHPQPSTSDGNEVALISSRPTKRAKR
jgi:hypothetical protein